MTSASCSVSEIKKINVVFCFFVALPETGKAGDSLRKNFFREEYTLNNAIGKVQCLSGHAFLITEVEYS